MAERELLMRMETDAQLARRAELDRFAQFCLVQRQTLAMRLHHRAVASLERRREPREIEPFVTEVRTGIGTRTFTQLEQPWDLSAEASSARRDVRS